MYLKLILYIHVGTVC